MIVDKEAIDKNTSFLISKIDKNIKHVKEGIVDLNEINSMINDLIKSINILKSNKINSENKIKDFIQKRILEFTNKMLNLIKADIVEFTETNKSMKKILSDIDNQDTIIQRYLSSNIETSKTVSAQELLDLNHPDEDIMELKRFIFDRKDGINNHGIKSKLRLIHHTLLMIKEKIYDTHEVIYDDKIIDYYLMHFSECKIYIKDLTNILDSFIKDIHMAHNYMQAIRDKVKVSAPITSEGFIDIEDPKMSSGNIKLWYKFTKHTTDACVIFLAGNAVNYTEFEVMREVFDKANISTLAYDTRGHGKSQKPTYVKSYDLDRLTMDLRGIIYKLGIDNFKRVIFVGQSVGSMTGVRYQTLYPDHKFDSLILLTPSHRYKDTLVETPLLKNIIHSHVKKHELLYDQHLSGDIDENLLKKLKIGKMSDFKIGYATDINTFDIRKAEMEFKKHKISDYRNSVNPEKTMAMPKYLNKFYFGSNLLRKFCEEHPKFNEKYVAAANIGQKFLAFWTDININTSYIGKDAKQFKFVNCLSGGSLFKYDITKDLEQLRVPTLIIGGEYDFLIDEKKIGKGRSPTFEGTVLNDNNEFVKGKFRTTFSYIGSENKDIFIIPGATHTLSFTHPYDCAWRAAKFIFDNLRDAIPYNKLITVMNNSKK